MLKDDLALTERKARAKEEALRRPPLRPFGGKPLTTNRSAVLLQPTIWSPRRAGARRRPAGNATDKWAELAAVRAYPLDEVNRFPCGAAVMNGEEDWFWMTHDVHVVDDADAPTLLGEALLRALDEPSSWAKEGEREEKKRKSKKKKEEEEEEEEEEEKR
ncbi:hypothetical protein B0A49_00867 [Cryomyces minteri]|uniref:Uncharacterized protein n=1 Tax=Cryomyces minteri TaxID=331657 RepID=A0A4U0XZF6_9PEZI|nr:hypothetical protein B0A49_00867 [Cryomyces minteri]